MSTDRRANAQSRRRRVLYQTSQDITTETPAERRAAEKLREARRPATTYGSHVNRRLRGRWFSLVPVGRLAISCCAIGILGTAILLTGLNWATQTWASLAYRPDLARPLMLSRPDSFGTWARAFFLAAAALTALLVYQLRRYKIDDYKGHYRIWRPVIVLIALMSIDSVCDLVPWGGAMVDGLLGKRVALSGADWIRIVLTVGGGALALRLVAEVRRSKIALTMMILALVGFVTPLSSRWNIFDATTLSGWTAVTSAPLLASAALWVSIGGYLRMLFREVRGLDDEQLAQRAEAAANRKAAKQANQQDIDVESPRGWFGRRKSAKGEGAVETTVLPTARSKREPKSVRTQPAAVSEQPNTEPKRGWFGSRKVKVKVERQPAAPAQSEPQQQPKVAETETNEKPKRSWFSRTKPKPADDGKQAAVTAEKPTVNAPKPQASNPVQPKPATTPAAEDAKPARKGLGGWLRRDPAPADTAAVQTPKAKPPAATPVQQNSAESDDDDEETGDDSVDWGAMNKSERRRMRKEMKRGGRAA